MFTRVIQDSEANPARMQIDTGLSTIIGWMDGSYVAAGTQTASGAITAVGGVLTISLALTTNDVVSLLVWGTP